MVHFLQITSRPASAWEEIRWLWKGDRLRGRHLNQVQEMRRWVLLEQCQMWIAWDSDPPPPPQSWMRPQHCIGTVITFVSKPQRTLTVQFAAGRRLSRWMPSAIRQMEQFAREHGCERLCVFVRKGWIQELPAAWKSSDLIQISFDPELLRGCPHPIPLCA